MRVIKTDDVGMVFFAPQNPLTIERDARRLPLGRSHSARVPEQRSGASTSTRTVRLPSSSRMRSPILFLRHSGIFIADANHAVAAFRLVQHAY